MIILVASAFLPRTATALGGSARFLRAPPATLKAQLAGDALLADPIVYTLDEGTLSRYERRVLVR